MKLGKLYLSTSSLILLPLVVVLWLVVMYWIGAMIVDLVRYFV